MTMREDREREEREREQKEKSKPVVLSSEELTEKVKYLKTQDSFLYKLIWGGIFFTAMTVGTLANHLINMKRSTPTAPDPTVIAQLTARIDDQDSTIAYLKAHADTTRLADQRQDQELATVRHNDEQRSSDIQRMTEAFDRNYLSASSKK